MGYAEGAAALAPMDDAAVAAALAADDTDWGSTPAPRGAALVDSHPAAAAHANRKLPPIRPGKDPAPTKDANGYNVGGQRYTIGKELGEGGFGTVNALDSAAAAAPKRVVKKATDVADGSLTNEAAIASHVPAHPNVIEGHGAIVDANGNATEVFSELAGGGDLDARGAALREMYEAGQISHAEFHSATQYLMRGTAAGLEHLAHNQITHNDLKPGNVLLGGDRDLDPKIADLGCAGLGEDADPGIGGTGEYRAPERDNAKTVSPKSDVFALGQMTNVMTTGRELTHDNLRNGQVLHPPKAKPVATPAAAAVARQDPDAFAAFRADIVGGKSDSGRDVKAAPTTAAAATGSAAAAKPGPLKTAYSEFLAKTTATDADARIDAKQAQKEKYLSNPILDDAAAKDVVARAGQHRMGDTSLRQPRAVDPRVLPDERDRDAGMYELDHHVRQQRHTRLMAELQKRQPVVDAQK